MEQKEQLELIEALDERERERPTLKTIARLSGMAVPTVSRALSDAPDIGAATKTKVRQFADLLGYRPNRAGLRLRTGKTNVIAIMLSTETDMMNHTARLINAVAGELRESSYHAIVMPYFPDDDPLDPVRYVVRTGSADGVILNRIQPNDPRIRYLRESRFPFVMHGRTDDCGNDPFFDFDNTAFAKLAIDALIKNNRKHVLLIAPDRDQSYAAHIVDGATKACRDAGLRLSILDDATSDDTSDHVQNAAIRFLKAHPSTDAILCSSAAAAMAAVGAVEDTGQTVGKGIDIVAKEAIPFLNAFRKNIIVCNEDIDQTGSFLAQALIQAIDKPDLPPMQKLIAPAPFA